MEKSQPASHTEITTLPNRAAHYALSAAALAKLRQISIEHVQAALDEVQ